MRMLVHQPLSSQYSVASTVRFLIICNWQSSPQWSFPHFICVSYVWSLPILIRKHITDVSVSTFGNPLLDSIQVMMFRSVIRVFVPSVPYFALPFHYSDFRLFLYAIHPSPSVSRFFIPSLLHSRSVDTCLFRGLFEFNSWAHWLVYSEPIINLNVRLPLVVKLSETGMSFSTLSWEACMQHSLRLKQLQSRCHRRRPKRGTAIGKDCRAGQWRRFEVGIRRTNTTFMIENCRNSQRSSGIIDIDHWKAWDSGRSR